MVAGLALGGHHSFSQNIQWFPCVGVPTNGTVCTDGKTGLRGNTITTISYATVAGHNVLGDGGGGDFINLGAASSICNTYLAGTVSGAGAVGSNQITSLTGIGITLQLNTLSVGELVTGSGTDMSGNSILVQPGTEIASVDTTNSKITLTLPLAGTSTVTTGVSMSNITFVGDNDGTLIIDSETGTSGHQCWQKTNYRGDPHEFGAYGDSNYQGTTGHDDTAPVQYWLGAYGNVNSGLAPTKVPPNFGPWIAPIPANYKINTPLYCPPNATIMGTENLQNGGTPRTNFVAGPHFLGFGYPFVTNTVGQLPSSFFGLQGVFAASAFCRLSGVAVSGNGFQLTPFGGGNMINGNNTITGLSTVTDSNGDPIQPGNAVTDASGYVPAGSVVTAVNTTCPCSVTISKNVTGTTLTPEKINFFGPDAVDVVGDHVTIDGY